MSGRVCRRWIATVLLLLIALAWKHLHQAPASSNLGPDTADAASVEDRIRLSQSSSIQTAKPPTSPSPHFSREALESIFQRGDLCEYDVFRMAHLDQTEEIERIQWEIFWKSDSGSGNRDELMSIHEGLFDGSDRVLELLTEPKSPLGKFVLGLTLAGMIDGNGFDGSPTDSRRGIKILEELVEQNPSNGYYRFFLIGAKAKAGVSAHQMHDDIRSLYESKRFENPFLPLTRTIYEMGFENPVMQIVSVGFLASLPIPSYSTTTTHLREVSESDPEIWENAIRFGKLMMKEQEDRATGKAMAEWWEIDHAIGRTIAQKNFERAYPGEPLPKEIDQKYVDLYPLHTGPTLDDYIEALGRLESSFFGGRRPPLPGVCDSHPMRVLLEREKAAHYTRIGKDPPTSGEADEITHLD